MVCHDYLSLPCHPGFGVLSAADFSQDSIDPRPERFTRLSDRFPFQDITFTFPLEYLDCV